MTADSLSSLVFRLAHSNHAAAEGLADELGKLVQRIDADLYNQSEADVRALLDGKIEPQKGRRRCCGHVLNDCATYDCMRTLIMACHITGEKGYLERLRLPPGFTELKLKWGSSFTRTAHSVHSFLSACAFSELD